MPLKMSQNLVEGSTHTGKAFQEFAYDLLAYAIPKFGREWFEPHFERRRKKIFKESFGDAIVLFRSRHEEEFSERLKNYLNTKKEEEFKLYAQKFCERTFKGNIPLMELIAYCAFLLDTTIFYHDIDLTDELFELLDDSCGVFNEHVKPYFTIVGGWHALYRVAEQYVNFVNFTPSGIASSAASASEGVGVSKL